MFLSIPNNNYANVSQLNKHEIPFREKKKGGGKNDTKETTGSQRYEVSSYSRVYPVTPVTLVACI